jgi:large subunit ribosomal protein L24e
MVERRVCTFCGSEIEPGTGRMYVKKDGVVYNFCTSKCFKNMVILGRVPRRTTWTRYFEREKQIRMKGGPEAVESPKKRARKVKKAEPAEEKAPEAVEEKVEEKTKEKPKEGPPPKTEEKKPEPPKEKKVPAKKSEKTAKAPAKKEAPKPEEGEKG